MKAIVSASSLKGNIQAIASKSVAHRYLIAAALGDREVFVNCHSVSEDIKATADCLRGMGAEIERKEGGFLVNPIRENPKKEKAILLCNESGSTLRFLLPIVAALGMDGEFYRKGSLVDRPLHPLDEQLFQKGVCLSKKEGGILWEEGTLQGGIFTLPGNVSSQYITGLLFALPLLDKDSQIHLTTPLQSEDYVKITLDVMEKFGVFVKYEKNCFYIQGKQVYTVKSELNVEGDWSNGAFFLTGGTLNDSCISYTGLNKKSLQGDKKIVDILRCMGADIIEDDKGIYRVCKGKLKGITIDASPIPDLVPILALAGAVAEGKTHIINAERLRIKESDRLKTVYETLHKLGAEIEEEKDGLVICGKEKLSGGQVSSYNDHRIVMMAAIASLVCEKEVVILNAEAVNKSYPGFFEDFKKLGGNVKIEED